MKKKFFIISSFIFFFSFAATINAATLSLLPEAKTFDIGKEFNVDIKINTSEASINAARATITFPTNVLELIHVDKTGSVFNFWLEEPTISNENGTLKFVGGTSKGVSGSALQILTLKFKASGTGSAELTLLDAVVTASDGKGTNVLSTIEGAAVAVGTNVVTPEPVKIPSPASLKKSAEETPPPSPLEEPKKVVRQAVEARNLPYEPALRVPLYPDQTRWYNHVGEVTVLWNVPDDVISIAVAFDQKQNTVPQKTEGELFTGKNIGILKEGIWYIHARFRNNVGWGKSAHYRVALDTSAPLPFEVKMDTHVTDNPRPSLQFETQDGLSGISHAVLFIDGKDPFTSTSTVILLPPQPPGKHTLLVKIFDLAGNSVEDDLEFEILPLPTPTIDFITKTVSQGELVFVSGKAIPNAFVDVIIHNAAGREVFKRTAATNAAEGWELIVKESLERGTYTLSAISRDERGATSYSSEAIAFRVKPKTIVSLGPLELGWFEILIILILIAASGVSVTAWYHVSIKKTREAYRIIIGRDIEKLGALLSDHLKELEGLQEVHDSSRSTQAVTRIERMKETISKMKKYLGEEVNKLK